MRIGRLINIAVLLALMSSACSVNNFIYVGRSCSETEPCAQGFICRNSTCQAAKELEAGAFNSDSLLTNDLGTADLNLNKQDVKAADLNSNKRDVITADQSRSDTKPSTTYFLICQNIIECSCTPSASGLKISCLYFEFVFDIHCQKNQCTCGAGTITNQLPSPYGCNEVKNIPPSAFNACCE